MESGQTTPLNQATDGTPYPVNVQLLLAGGHQHELTLSSDAPLLQQLFTILMNQTQPEQTPSLIQIPLQNGQRAIAFSSDKLVCIATEPPIFAQKQPAAANQSAPSTNPVFTSTTAKTTPTTTAVSPQNTAPKPSYRYIQIENFLPSQLHQQFLDYAISSREEYVETGPATNTDFYKDHRNSLVIYYPRYADILLEHLNKVMPKVIQHLELPEFEVDRIETQLTAHNDGNYYKIHNDNGSEETAARQLTYVYYFYREPKAFSGGNLAIYDTELRDGRAHHQPNHQIIEPINNSIVFFPSFYMHEVRPVACPSKAFLDSRFTLNGWIRKPELATLQS